MSAEAFKSRSDTDHKYFSEKPKQEANNEATINIMQKIYIQPTSL